MIVGVDKDVIKVCKENSIETFIGGQIADNEKFITKLNRYGLTGVSVNPDIETVNKMINFYSKLEMKNN